jgi:hypothetical protein
MKPRQGKNTKTIVVATTSTEHGGKQNENTVVATKPIAS